MNHNIHNVSLEIMQNLKQLVKKIQFLTGLSVENVAKSINYSRVHLTKEMKKGENVEIEKLLLEKYKETLQNVLNETGEIEMNEIDVALEYAKKNPLHDKTSKEWAVMRLMLSELASIRSKIENRPFQDCLDELNDKVRLMIQRL